MDAGGRGSLTRRVGRHFLQTKAVASDSLLRSPSRAPPCRCARPSRCHAATLRSPRRDPRVHRAPLSTPGRAFRTDATATHFDLCEARYGAPVVALSLIKANERRRRQQSTRCARALIECVRDGRETRLEAGRERVACVHWDFAGKEARGGGSRRRAKSALDDSSSSENDGRASDDDRFARADSTSTSTTLGWSSPASSSSRRSRSNSSKTSRGTRRGEVPRRATHATTGGRGARRRRVALHGE